MLHFLTQSDGDESKDNSRDRAKLTLEWGTHEMSGVACDLTSPGFSGGCACVLSLVRPLLAPCLTRGMLFCCAALKNAFQEVRGTATPFSITGSLPLVADLKAAGFGAFAFMLVVSASKRCFSTAHTADVLPLADLQICGFGLSSTYHADNEYCTLTDMKNAVKVLARFVANLN